MKLKTLILVGFMFSLFSFFRQDEAYEVYLKKMYESFSVNQIDFTELKKLKKFTLIDTREKEEYTVSHIENALNVSYDDFDIDQFKRNSKTDTIVLYCSVGYRSCKIAEVLNENGYKHVFNLYGGIFKWVNDSNKIFSDHSETKKLHTYNKKWGRYVQYDSIIKIN